MGCIAKLNQKPRGIPGEAEAIEKTRLDAFLEQSPRG